MSPRNIVTEIPPTEDDLNPPGELNIEPVITEETHTEKKLPMKIVWRNVFLMTVLHLTAFYSLSLIPVAHVYTLIWGITTYQGPLDDKRYWVYINHGRSKEVRTLELIGQIKNFMDKDSHVSIKTVSAQFDVIIIHKELKMQKIYAKFVPRVLRRSERHNSKMGIKTVPYLSHSPDIASYNFCLFPKLKENLRDCRYETIEMNKAVTRVVGMLTQGFPWGLPEAVRTVQVHCSWRRLLRMGLL